MQKVRNEKEMKKLMEDELFANHFWVTESDEDTNDIIVLKNKVVCMIIPKISRNLYFYFSRVSKEEELILQKWIKKTQQPTYYAVWIEEVIYLIPYEVVQKFKKNGQTKMTFVEIIDNSILFEDFLEVKND